MKRKVENIVLIGMPGCGKTTIGKLLSKELKLNYCDIDCYIEEKEKRSIKELFENGEDYFRDLESKACIELASKKNTVISAGGGVIKRKNNIDILKEQGVIVFIDRPVENIISDINISARPLLKDGTDKVYKLYEERYTLYKEYSDIIVGNEGYLKDVTNDIIMKVKNLIK